MQRILGWATVVLLLLNVSQARAVTATFDFEDGTDQGWGSSFGANDASQNFPIVTIGGSKRMETVLGGFQVASINSSSNPYLAAMNLGMAFPNVSTISYDWYVDTAGVTGGQFLQIGTYINSGQNPFSYRQDFDNGANRSALTGTDLSSGAVFQGTNSFTFFQRYETAPLAPPLQADFQNAPGQRFGLILNANSGIAGVKVYFDNIRITGVPEPASIVLCAMAVPAMLLLRRRKK